MTTSTREQIHPGGFLLNLERGTVRPVHYELFPNERFRSLLVGWNEDVFSIVSRVPPHQSGPPAHWHDVDQLFYCLRGELELRLGEESHILKPGTLAIIPAGTNHSHRNLGDEEEVHLELIVPGTIPLRPLLHPVESTDVGEWTGRGVVVSSNDNNPGALLDSVTTTLKASASEGADLPWQCAEILVESSEVTLLPASSGAQSWYVIEGTITVNDAEEASKDSMILLTGPKAPTLAVPAGVRTRAFAVWPDGGLFRALRQSDSPAE